MGPPGDIGSGGDEGLTLLDRSVSVVLKDPDETASRKDHVSPRLERLHRLHGTSLIFEASKLLALGPSTYATACTMFHRFYQQASLVKYDVWSVALASILLSTKVEEEPQTLKTIIHAFCHLYRKRILVVNPSIGEADCRDWDHASLRSLNEAKKWSLERKEKFLGDLPLPMKLGPVFEDWHKQSLISEATLLRQLGFTLYWIPDSHPHKFILYFCQALGLTQPQVCLCSQATKRLSVYRRYQYSNLFSISSSHNKLGSIVTTLVVWICAFVSLQKSWYVVIPALDRWLREVHVVCLLTRMLSYFRQPPQFFWLGGISRWTYQCRRSLGGRSLSARHSRKK
jgi:hypothetical protein